MLWGQGGDGVRSCGDGIRVGTVFTSTNAVRTNLSQKSYTQLRFAVNYLRLSTFRRTDGETSNAAY